jgi:hypothetical protein
MVVVIKKFVKGLNKESRRVLEDEGILWRL